jgi:hypothetical protein
MTRGVSSGSHFDRWRRQNWNLRPLRYELAGDSFTSIPTSQTSRSPPTADLCHRGAFHTISAVAPRFVHKSVHTATAADTWREAHVRPRRP